MKSTDSLDSSSWYHSFALSANAAIFLNNHSRVDCQGSSKTGNLLCVKTKTHLCPEVPKVPQDTSQVATFNPLEAPKQNNDWVVQWTMAIQKDDSGHTVCISHLTSSKSKQSKIAQHVNASHSEEEKPQQNLTSLQISKTKRNQKNWTYQHTW